MKEEIKDKTWYEEVKEDFVKNISDTYTLNLAISILEDRKELLDKNLDLQSQLKAKEETEKEFTKYLEEEINKIKEQINNYNIWHEVVTDINFLILKKQFKMEILSKYKEILAKGENK